MYIRGLLVHHISPVSHSLPSTLHALLERGARLAAPRPAPDEAVLPLEDLCRRALEGPVGSPPARSLATPRSRVALVVSDATRDEPREEMLAALRDELGHVPDGQITIVIASGTHAPRPPGTVLSARWLERHPVVVHDGHDPAAVFDAGTTPAGTRVRLNRALQADLVVSTGRIRPHYFAGYSGGAKGIFPGCALATDARQNHLLKAEASARLGRLGDNPCRLDMEEAARLLPGATFLLNTVADCDGRYVAAAAGDLVAAHRAACRAAGPLFEASDPGGARAIVVSDLPPVTSSLYQASKLLPPAGPLLDEEGMVIMVAGCEEGIGPLQTVNEGIYRLGVRHHLPRGHRVRLVSTMKEELARQSYATPSPDLPTALAEAGFGGPLDGLLVLWRAGEAITRRVGAASAVRQTCE